jgi:Domain of unknown function (DUF6429)
MTPDTDKIDEDVLALLFLTSFRQKKGMPPQAWKGHDWDVLNRLCEKGFISDPKNKNKSVWFTDEGFQKAKDLFEAKYSKKG